MFYILIYNLILGQKAPVGWENLEELEKLGNTLWQLFGRNHFKAGGKWAAKEAQETQLLKTIDFIIRQNYLLLIFVKFDTSNKSEYYQCE